MARAELEVKLTDYAEVREALQMASDVVAIVRDLAEIGSPHDHEYGDCMLCEKLSRNDPVEPEDHDPTCPWRRAREWVAGHVVVTTSTDEAKT